MLSKKSLDNMFAVYYAATSQFYTDGQPGWADWLCDEFGHELHRWQVWMEEGSNPEDRPEDVPTMADLNHYLAETGYKGIGGKNPRVVRI